MAKGDRIGNRKTREQRRTIKVPELGYYLIVTDTEGTERCFFTGLHQSLPEEVKNKLVIKVVETKTQNMIEKCLEMTAYEAQYRRFQHRDHRPEHPGLFRHRQEIRH